MHTGRRHTGGGLRAALLAVGTLGAGGGWAAVGADEAARLGHELTPAGAEAAGNAAGTIPAWEGRAATARSNCA